MVFNSLRITKPPPQMVSNRNILIGCKMVASWNHNLDQDDSRWAGQLKLCQSTGAESLASHPGVVTGAQVTPNLPMADNPDRFTGVNPRARPIFAPHLKPLHSPVHPSLPAPLSPSNGRTKSLKASISWNLRDARCFNSARSFVDRWPQPLHCAALGGHYYRKLHKSAQRCRNLLKFTEPSWERVRGGGSGGHPAKVAAKAMEP